jgi:5-methylcytosine-specific restriction endonuclease McrA
MNTSFRDPGKTLVLNSSYIATQIISSCRAFVVHYKGNADVLTVHPDEFFTTTTTKDKYPKPSIIRVNKWVHVDYNKIPFSRENVYRRDQYTCVYCGSKDKTTLTLDHVHPRAKGGKDSWENVVTACRRCNNEKADLLIEEWGREHPNPCRPHYLLLIHKNTGTKIPDEWKPYLFL